ncbi:hypothetical protein NVI2019_PEGOAJLN_02930 [Providencia alcalifaciens]|uniref:Caudovirales tail fiber assembly protein n=3 Tax=Providencia alcalifaciens TaxID=126385 RepID=B6XDJ9_9GAMM|nr:tail fiber assembly protein [Providencia alcalifaciens]ATG16354.1 tail assembly chaperone [Providencia alcalifaciens]EEB46521.1 caudovirales tail fiber assembly protein [Providencia alcalifaciens DSM 30120]MTC65060.1 tail fiber assembly protein [Providencia alcalifaciens]WGZ53179.1 tail fiber assembly protein [Providencia alcalifaciens]CAG9415439.1 hypothetical protein NVI2019_PEGOAJLN_01229 [Providencia alcalifaciens]
MIYQNFQRSHNPKLLAKYPESTLVLEDIEGNDWYEVQANFNGDTLKIVFNPDGLIISYSHDASALFPLGGSVAEMSPHELPKNFFDEKQSFVFIDGKVLPYEMSKETLVAKAENTLRLLLNEATIKIDSLQDAVDLEIATDAEIVSLKEWKKYRVLLNRVDTSTAPDVLFPEKPE